MISSHVAKTVLFYCSICEEESTRICVSCTKDTCGNHLCAKCVSCSDCCSCELSLDPEPPYALAALHDPEPHPHPMPDPDPAPKPDQDPMNSSSS